jgi:hypothetical protein
METGAQFMSISTSKRALAAALTSLAILGATSLARADVNDYEFQLVEKEINKGDAILSVRLVHKPDGKAVPDAVIFATRLDMAPDSMAEMQTSIAPMPSVEPGVYRFKALLTMAGGWRLSLAAKIQGENGTLENQLILRALP